MFWEYFSTEMLDPLSELLDSIATTGNEEENEKLAAALRMASRMQGYVQAMKEHERRGNDE
jgi:hypothetical protein